MVSVLRISGELTLEMKEIMTAKLCSRCYQIGAGAP